MNNTATIIQYSNDYNDASYCLVQNNCLNYDSEVEEYYKENYGYDVEAANSILRIPAGLIQTGMDMLTKMVRNSHLFLAPVMLTIP